MQFASLVLALPAALLGNDAAQPAKETPDNPAAVRKALDQNITLDFKGEDLDEALNHLSEKAKLKIVVQYYFAQPVSKVGGGPEVYGGFYPGFGGYGGLGASGGAVGALGAFGTPGGNPVPGTPGFPTPSEGPVILKINNGKVRTALQNLIAKTNLSVAIVGDTVLLSSEEFAQAQMLKQRLPQLEIKGRSLAEALKDLSDDSSMNVIIDPRQSEKAKTKLDLKLQDVTVETALRLMLEFSDLDWVTVGNVMLVTTSERARQIRKDNEAAQSKVAIHYLPPVSFPYIGGKAPAK